MAQLIGRLLEKTRSAQIKWERAAERGKFQSRFGDFVLLLSGTQYGGLMPNEATLNIQRLDGRPVGNLSTNPGAISIVSGTTTTSEITRSQLRELYGLVANSSDDLDELLRLI